MGSNGRNLRYILTAALRAVVTDNAAWARPTTKKARVEHTETGATESGTTHWRTSGGKNRKDSHITQQSMDVAFGTGCSALGTFRFYHLLIAYRHVDYLSKDFLTHGMLYLLEH